MMRLIAFVLALLLATPAMAQVSADFRQGGGVLVGPSTTTCDGAAAGGLRYNATDDYFEYCNGTAWTAITAPPTCPDMTPNGFSFTDQTGVTISTLTTSNIVQINGLGCGSSVNVSGTGGSPTYRICSDAACATVVQDWTSSAQSVSDGQYLQLRVTSSGSGSTTHGVTVGIGGTSDYWTVTTTDGCSSGSPTIGTTCADGTVYIGLSPDGNEKMYATRCDAGMYESGGSCNGNRTALPFNNGASAATSLVNATDGSDGDSNTALLANQVMQGYAPYMVAKYCADLTMHGRSDWYLPSSGELAVMRAAAGLAALSSSFVFTNGGSYYWSSSEHWANNGYGLHFYNAVSTSLAKHSITMFRCVRRDSNCTDGVPSAFDFTDQTGVTANTLTTSNIVQITGLDCRTPVTISGASGTPNFRICSDSACNTVVQDWTSTLTWISPNQYLQLRMTSATTSPLARTATVTLGTTIISDTWTLTSVNDCTTSGAVGTVCDDGSVYAGLSPDGNVRMYATRCDMGSTFDGTACSTTRSGIPWSNGGSTTVATGVTSTTDGDGNTATLAALNDVESPHAAAKYCADLTMHGKSDWYLPAEGELQVLRTNGGAIGGFTYTNNASFYYSSTEHSATQARLNHFVNSTTAYSKAGAWFVRCVRHD